MALRLHIHISLTQDVNVFKEHPYQYVQIQDQVQKDVEWKNYVALETAPTLVKLMTPIFWLQDVTPKPAPTAEDKMQSKPSTSIPRQQTISAFELTFKIYVAAINVSKLANNGVKYYR